VRPYWEAAGAARGGLDARSVARISGPAGTGKSFVLRCAAGVAESEFAAEVVRAATAGIAATHIGGSTIHSIIGLGRDTASDIDELTAGAAKGLRSLSARKLALLSARGAIIAEASVASAQLLDAVDLTLRHATHAAEAARVEQVATTELVPEGHEPFLRCCHPEIVAGLPPLRGARRAGHRRHDAAARHPAGGAPQAGRGHRRGQALEDGRGLGRRRGRAGAGSREGLA